MPNIWDSKVSGRWRNIPTQDACPDEEIEIYVEGNKYDLIYVYGQIGNVSFSNKKRDSAKFITNKLYYKTLFLAIKIFPIHYN